MKSVPHTGLFFGSFNPIHIGHLALANYMAEFTELDEVWLVISPQNPLKKKSGLLHHNDRYHLAQLALDFHPKIKLSKAEFELPQPSYTVNTLAHLKEQFPDRKFSIIMGADNLSTLSKWKNHEYILANHKIFVYPRRNATASPFDHHPNVKFTQAPEIDISSTFIRDSVKEKKDVRFFLHPEVWKYIEENNLYRRTA